MLSRQATILADVREKKPLPFPKHISMLSPFHPPDMRKEMVVELVIKKAHLHTADYVLEHGEDGSSQSAVYVPEGAYPPGRRSAIIERKYSLREIAGDLLTKRKRASFIRRLTRMREQWDRPYLLMEGSLTRLYKSAYKMGPGPCLDTLIRVCKEQGVQLLFVEGDTQLQRRLVADLAARILINEGLAHDGLQSNPLPELDVRRQA